MTLKAVKDQIKQFLASPTPEVLAIRGAWGTGKTYLWNSLLKAAAETQTIGLRKYAYVSLFGTTTLDSAKVGVFQNTVETTQIGRPPSLESFKKNSDGFWASLGRSSSKLVEYIPGANDFSAALN